MDNNEKPQTKKKKQKKNISKKIPAIFFLMNKRNGMGGRKCAKEKYKKKQDNDATKLT
jgi:hypothetical protein